MSCVIFSAAAIFETVSVGQGDYIICADGGYLHVQKLGLVPNVILGDFDSAPMPTRTDCEVIVTPAEKDDTDTMLAVKLAIERGYTDIKLYGALGGRLDHTIANLQAAAFAKEKGATLILSDDKNTAFMIQDERVRLPKTEGYLSVLSYSDECVGVSETGVKYPLDNETINSRFPLGVSNEIIEEFCEISVEKGMLLIIISKD